LVTKGPGSSLKPLDIAKIAARAARDKKSIGTCVLDLRGISPITDYFVICSVTSEIQGRAVADHVQEELSDSGVDVWHVEGYENARWILLDYIDVVMHIFQEEARDFYGLDRLWGDALKVTVRAARKQTRKG
jgi:ribosome-associated protein